MKRQSKQLFGALLLSSLTACGGGSGTTDDVVIGIVDQVVNDNNDNDNNDNDNNDNNNDMTGMGAGTGGCVTFPRPVVGQIVKRELKQSGGGVSISKETEITAISATSITQKILVSGLGLVPESINVEKYTIANNFRDITSESVEVSGFTFNTSYTPFQRVPVDKVCEGQTWTTVYTEKEEGEVAVNHSKTYIIEAVNVSKTTAAGTFNTFRVKQEDVDVFGTSWIDIKSGYDVLSEFGDTSGNLEGTLELVEKNF